MGRKRKPGARYANGNRKAQQKAYNKGKGKKLIIAAVNTLASTSVQFLISVVKSE